MSLLIKALQKAEDEKKSDAKSAKEDFSLSLEDLPSSVSQLAEESESAPLFNDEPESQGGEKDRSGIADEVDKASVAETSPVASSYSSKLDAEEQKKEASRQAAATMLAAKASQKNPGSTKKGILLLLVFLALAGFGGVEFYSYLQSLEQPAIVMAKRPDATTSPQTQTSQSAVASPDNTVSELPTTPVDVAKAEIAATVDKTIDKLDFALDQVKQKAGLETAKMVAPKDEKPVKPEPMVFGESVNINPETSSVKVTKNLSVGRVNPDLTAAYLALNSGDDATAQRSYRQVLKNDIRNTDALLGMAAVAIHQGRIDDAIGWYGKVLEIEPRNTIAQVAMVSAAGQADPIGSASRIKSMIAQQPEAAYLHAALGNIYADQGAWPQAQQSYFQAFHFDPNNAEYAFNLAVSLDQLGKSGLALQYYKQALDLAQKTNNTSVDRTQLESRISQLNY